MTVGVLIVCDVRLYGEGLMRVLLDHPDVDPVCVVRTSSEAVAGLTRVSSDVVLVDCSMASCVEVIRDIADSTPRAPILVYGLSARAENEVVAYAEAGAFGYVTRDSSLEDLVGCITAAAVGESRCSPRVAASLMRSVRRLGAMRVADPRDTLTRRESHVLDLISDGLSNKEIARQLNIEVSTVKNHVHNLLSKLNVCRRNEAAALIRGRPHRQA